MTADAIINSAANGTEKITVNRPDFLGRMNLPRGVVLLFLVLVIAACRPQEAVVQPTALPTLSPTPRSTPLPVVATAVPPGQESNPLQIVLRPFESLNTARAVLDDLEDAILNQSGITVNFELVNRDAEALAALCASSSGRTAAVWVGGVEYLAAEAMNCGQPVLQVERGTRANASTGSASSVIVRAGSSLAQLSALNDRIFCRLSYDDVSTWLIPVLLLQASGVNITDDLQQIRDYDSIPELVKAVASRQCDAAGIPSDALEQFDDDLGDTVEQVNVIATSLEFPYAVMLLPAEVPLGTRVALNDAFIRLARDQRVSSQLRSLLGQSAIIAAVPSDFDELVEFGESTGLDFAQLGN